MRRPGPLMQMTTALVGLAGMLVLLADLFFGVLSHQGQEARQARASVSETLAVQVVTLLQRGDTEGLQRTLDEVVQRGGDIRSLAVRRADGTFVYQAGDHTRHWRLGTAGASVADQLTVPLHADGRTWGSFEVAYTPPPGNVVTRFLGQPIVITLMFVSVAGTLVFWLYMRRALTHLDPSSVIPERVQGAFDAMAEGVVVLDGRGRILLANRAMRAMLGEAAFPLGQPLSSLSLWGGGLPESPADHPWMRAMTERTPNAGHTVEAQRDGQPARQLVINCAPISEPGGAARGCMVTVNDVSELHQANQALRTAMQELNASKEEVQRQNAELARLATRDPLTGCLNRRAFQEMLDTLFAEAARTRTPISCVMVDIDHFKRVNDEHGHAVGDRVIRQVAKQLLQNMRGGDLVCRYGGEEFSIVLPGTGLQDALAQAERLRAAVEREVGPGVREVPGMRITASVGVDTRVDGVETPAAMIDRADQALYRSKRGGRNRVTAYAAPDEAVEAEAVQ